MPENTSGWVGVLNNIPKELAGVGMAMFIAAVRVIYDKQETAPTRIILESLLCGALSLTASFGISALGLSIDWVVFVGGAIGYVGSVTVRGLALKILSSKIKNGD